MKRFSRLAWCALALGALLSGSGILGFGVRPAGAQSGPFDGAAGLGRADELGGGFGESAGDLTVNASILPPTGNRPAQLAVAVDIPPGWHTYSITQPPHGPNRTLIKLAPSDEYRLDGPYTADPAPHVRLDDAFPGVPQEEHTGHVTWTAPLEFRQGVDLARLQISGSVYAQRCSTGCLPPKNFKFTAMLASTQAPVAASAAPLEQEKLAVGQYQAEGSSAVVRGWLETPMVSPGSTVRLVLSIDPGPGAHVYALAARDPNAVGNGKPTLIASGAYLAGSNVPWKIDAPQPDRPAVQEKTGADIQAVYEEPVRWTVDVHVPGDASGCYMLDGIISYQTCMATSCEFPKAARFSGKLIVMPNARNDARKPSPLAFLPALYGEMPKPSDLPAGGGAAAPEISSSSTLLGQLHPQIKGTEPTNLAVVIFYGLIGGLILNLMPCVLPVIGLKVLAFVEQGGHNRARAFALNLWYSLGLLLVFMILATLAVNLQLKWGQQFQSPAFDIVLCGVVFVMALSFLGVWEIPIPGFIGSGKSAKLAAKEGAVGAFAKGAITTVLATPCSGPYLGAVFGYALTQSPLVTYIVFASIGLGMASPYLLIGAFPALVRFLPKPGAWMETFKQLMGFVLLGTVVYLFSLLEPNLFLPVLTLLVGLWAGCWWIGRTPLTANLGRKLWAWGAGAGIAAAVGWFAFTFVVEHPALLVWEPYSTSRLEQLLAERKTVMVDFTANWCPNCKLNSARAINTKPVEQVVRDYGVVPLLADWSNPSSEIERMLKALHSASIPVLAIFPADRPNEPIVLRDVISQSEVVDALQKAGPSRIGIAATGPTRN